MRVRQVLRVLVAVAAALPCLACAEEEEGGRGAVRVPGRWRIEGGLESARAADREARPAALRLGVEGRVALHAERGGVVLETLDDTPAVADVDFLGGARWSLRAGNAGGFAGTPWLAGSGGSSSAWRAAGVRPAARATAEWSLPQDFLLGLTPAVLVDRDAEGRRHAAGLLALTLARNWSPHWRGLVGLTGKAGSADAPLALDAGVAYRAGGALQFDFSVSHGLGGGAPSAQAGLGLSTVF